MTIHGGCLCRAVRFHSTASPLVVRICWCRACQFLGAGSGTVNVCFERAALSIEGSVSDYCSVADSGNVMHRGFCPQCGTPLFSTAEARPHLIFVRAGALDDPELARPTATIWTSQAPTWACLDERTECVSHQPPPAA